MLVDGIKKRLAWISKLKTNLIFLDINFKPGLLLIKKVYGESSINSEISALFRLAQLTGWPY